MKYLIIDYKNILLNLPNITIINSLFQTKFSGFTKTQIFK